MWLVRSGELPISQGSNGGNLAFPWVSGLKCEGVIEWQKRVWKLKHRLMGLVCPSELQYQQYPCTWIVSNILTGDSTFVCFCKVFFRKEALVNNWTHLPKFRDINHNVSNYAHYQIMPWAKIGKEFGVIWLHCQLGRDKSSELELTRMSKSI